MSKTKKLYAQQLISNLYPSPTADKKLEEQEAMLVVSQARDAIVKKYLYQNYAEDRTPFGNWLSYVDGIEILYDEDRCVWYSQLQVLPISFINNGGINTVWIGNNPDDTIKPVEASFLQRTKGRYSGLENSLGYYLEGDKLIYVQDMRNIKKDVRMRLIADSSTLGVDDLFPIDGSVETEMMQLAIQFSSVQKQFPQDVISNGVSE